MTKHDIFTYVYIKHNPKYDLDYELGMRQNRKEMNSQKGTIIAESNSHGLCYHVKNSTHEAWFEPDELTNLEKHD